MFQLVSHSLAIESMILPTNEQFPDVSELSFRETFRKDVCLLFLGVDTLGDNPFGFADL